jgi:hypothetical protein
MDVRFSKLTERISATAPLSRLGLADIGALKEHYPELPADYLWFLTEVGFGDLGELQLHSGPSAAGNFHPAVSHSLEHVIVFGDDKQGYCFGFDMNDGYRVIEIGPNGEVSKDIEPDFSGILQAYCG